MSSSWCTPYVLMPICMYACMCACVHVCACVRACVCICVCKPVCVCARACGTDMYVCLSIHAAHPHPVGRSHLADCEDI